MSVRHALLVLLEQGPRYGYQLRAEFEQHTGSTWPLNVGQVYTTLNRLDRDGLVRTAGEDAEGHVVYEVTDAGRDEVAAWFTSPVSRSTPPRDELAIKPALAGWVRRVKRACKAGERSAGVSSDRAGDGRPRTSGKNSGAGRRCRLPMRIPSSATAYSRNWWGVSLAVR